MPRPPDEELFESSKMTFGEHLEELRAALFKSLIALLIGFGMGLAYGGRGLVEMTKVPLTAALESHYRDLTTRRFEQLLADRRTAGESVPERSDAIQDLVMEDGLLFVETYIDPREIVRELKKSHPDEFAGVELPELPAGTKLRKTDMVRFFAWHRMEDDVRNRVFSSAVQGGFMVYIKASLVVGAVIASPFIFFFMWTFVADGLYPHEKHFVHIFMPFSLGLFLAGAALAFFVVTRIVVQFLFGFNAWMGIDPDPRIDEWLSFVLPLPLGFGVSFQLPLVMLFLERIGVFSVDAYVEKWRVAVLVIAVLSMLLTPADPGSMLLMAVPLIVLYFGGVLLCRLMPRRKAGG